MKLTLSKDVQITDLFYAIFPREAAASDVDCRKINRLAAFVELPQDAFSLLNQLHRWKPDT